MVTCYETGTKEKPPSDLTGAARRQPQRARQVRGVFSETGAVRFGLPDMASKKEHERETLGTTQGSTMVVLLKL